MTEEYTKITINDLLAYGPEIFSINKANGFWDMGVENRSFPQHIALVHSEVSEALEADRKDLNDDKLTEYLGRDVELADVAIRVLDNTAANEINLEDDTEIVLDYVDFSEFAAELHMLISKWYLSGRYDYKTPYVILREIVDYVNDNEIPFIEIIDKKLAVNKARGYKHGGKNY